MARDGFFVINDMPMLDTIRADEVKAFGYTFDYGTHHFHVYRNGELLAASGHSHYHPGMPESYFERALFTCWREILKE